MENNTLGDNIARFRKAAGLTQEELGTTVGVSAQAVSRWECGGAPDVALLPAIADALGVSIDSLFGREPGAQIDVERVVARWLNTFPEEERPDRFCRLLFSSINSLMPENLNLPKMNYLETANGDGLGDSDGLMYTQFWFKGGILLDVHAEDLSFSTLFPRPRDGYAKWLAPKEDYRRLFALLSRPNCLEFLWWLHCRKRDFFSLQVAAAALRLPCEDLEALAKELISFDILIAIDVEMESGPLQIYQLRMPIYFIPFLYITRSFMQGRYNYLSFGGDPPILGPDETWPEKKEET